MQAKKNDFLRSHFLLFCFFLHISRIVAHPLDRLSDKESHQNLHRRDIPPVSGIFNTSWTTDSTNYEILVDTIDCDNIPKKAVLGDVQMLNDNTKLDATYNDILVDGYDRLKQNPDPKDLQEAKAKHLLVNMRAAEKELSSLIEVPTTAADSGHDELRRLLFSKKQVADSMLQKARFTAYMFPQIALGYVLGAGIAYSVGIAYPLDTSPPETNMTDADTSSNSVNYLQCGLLVGGIYVIIALIVRFGEFAGGMDGPVPIFTNDEYIAMLTFVAWLRRVVRQMLERRPPGIPNQPGAVAAAGVQGLPMLVQAPQNAPPGVDGVVTQSQLETLQEQRAQGVIGGSSASCV